MEAVCRDYQSAPISQAEKVLFAFLERVTLAPADIRQEDVEQVRQAGWSDEALYDAITVCSLFNFYNRWVDGTGVQDMPEAAYRASGQRIADHGYRTVQHPASSSEDPH